MTEIQNNVGLKDHPKKLLKITKNRVMGKSVTLMIFSITWKPLSIKTECSKPGVNFLMSGIPVCATNQGRFFNSKNPEQAPDFELFSGTGPDF